MHKRGELLLVPFPFTDLSAAKRRPVLALTAPDSYGDFIALPVTSRPQFQNAIALTPADLVHGHLPAPSWIAARSEHPHQALDWRAGGRSELLEADGRVDVGAERCPRGFEVAPEQGLDGFAEKRSAERRIARCALTHCGVEAAGQGHAFLSPARGYLARFVKSPKRQQSTPFNGCCAGLSAKPSRRAIRMDCRIKSGNDEQTHRPIGRMRTHG
jgi:hypothetical protein